MNNKQAIEEHPVISELRNRIRKCKEELLILLDDWHYMQNVRQPYIVFLYESIFGDLEIELQKKSRVRSELERRIELLSLKLKRGERLSEDTITFVEKVVANEFNRQQKFSPNGDYQRKQYSGSHNVGFTAEKDMRKRSMPHLYRTIVKKLHPDIAGESDFFKKYWDNVQNAYKTKNLHRLEMFYKILCEENQHFPDIKSEESALRQEIQELEINIAAERRRIERMKCEEPFSFEDKLDDRTWIIRRKRKLQEKLFQIDRNIRHHQRLLSNLTAKKSGGNGSASTFNNGSAKRSFGREVHSQIGVWE